MPTEIRRLIFSDAELMEALTQFISSDRTAIEPGRVIGVEIATKDPCALKCAIQGRSGMQNDQIFDAVFLCAALIAWCMKNKVPLARSAKKAVKLTQTGKVALDVTL
ncbi:hypothetical protein ACM64Y_04675 [Novispirillum sp. DQ9]|uniref:hypothetical protein n=1 Tax=Novispirillum sp. DQ9 TaxID=3398612 RepID=UPI003C7CC250